MTQPGYQQGSEPMLWWKVALHLDEAQIALANALAHNLDDPRSAQALQDRLREGQVILLEIFCAKGLLPASSNGAAERPAPPDGPPIDMPAPPGWVPGAWVPAAQEPASAAHEDATSAEVAAQPEVAADPEVPPSAEAPSLGPNSEA